MKKTFSPALGAGIALTAAYILTNRFVISLPDYAAFPLALLSALLMITGIFEMMLTPSETKKIADNIYAVRAGIVNFYIYEANGVLIAFDTGISAASSKRGLEKLGLLPDKVSHVFLTHSDYDHTGGLDLFKNAEVYLSEKEEPMVTGQKARLLFRYNKKLRKYRALKDREVVEVNGVNVQIISTPGHTPGSACYLINGRALVSGDTLRIRPDGSFTPFLFFQNMDHSGVKLSLKLLKEESLLKKPELVLSGHTGYFYRKSDG